MEPAVSEDGTGFQFVVPVAPHDLGSSNRQFARFTDRQLALAGFKVHDARLSVRERHADRVARAIAIDGIAVGDRTGFGEPIAFGDLHICQPFEAVLHLGMQGAGAAETDAQRAQVISIDVGKFGDLHEHHRDG